MGGDQPKERQPEHDWLSDWDEWAATAEAFRDWIGVPYFFLVRYPRLRPRLRRRHRVELFGTVLSLAGGMARRVRPLCVLKNLRPRQRLQLGALLFDIDADYQFNREQAPRHVGRVNASKQGLRSVRRLNQKLGNAADALDELAAYLEELQTRWPISAGVIGRGTPQFSVVRDHAECYRSAKTPEAEIPLLRDSLDHIAQPLPGFKRPQSIKAEATIELTSFFVTECGCSRTEADIRTTKIGNHLWTWDDKIREKYAGEDKFRGAEGARSRRRRHQKPRRAS